MLVNLSTSAEIEDASWKTSHVAAKGIYVIVLTRVVLEKKSQIIEAFLTAMTGRTHGVP